MFGDGARRRIADLSKIILPACRTFRLSPNIQSWPEQVAVTGDAIPAFSGFLRPLIFGVGNAPEIIDAGVPCRVDASFGKGWDGNEHQESDDGNHEHELCQRKACLV